MKYEFSIDSQSFMPNKIDGIKWEDLHYPPNSNDLERAEIDKLVNEEFRGKNIKSYFFDTLISGTLDCILDQVNVDRQVEEIKKSRRPGLLWFVRAKYA
jgi:hypothetical protein